MHPEAWEWLKAKVCPELARVQRVLDLGGYDVNGTPRPLFSEDTRYTVIDVKDGPNVDITVDVTRWRPPYDYRSAFDVTLCTEVFEHVEDWRGIIYNMWVTLKPSGTCLITCATHPRPPHSMMGVEPPPAHEWYRNVSLEEILPVIRFLFRDVQHTVHPRGDLYIRGRK